MVIKQFLLLGLAAEYWIEISVDAINIAADHHNYDTRRRTKLTAPETISRWLLLKNEQKIAFEPPFLDLGVTYALQL